MAYTTPIQPVSEQSILVPVHNILAGITGIPGNLVRVKWQANPPPVPPIQTDYITFGILNNEVSNFPERQHTDEQVSIILTGLVHILVTVYGPNSQDTLSRLLLGLSVPQNIEETGLSGLRYSNYTNLVNTTDVHTDIGGTGFKGQVYQVWEVTLIFARQIVNTFQQNNVDILVESLTNG